MVYGCLKPYYDGSNVKGEPVQIINCENDSFTLDEDALKRVLCQKEIKDKPVCIVSVAGAFRKGKSFLLNFLLRYLRSKDTNNWMRASGDEFENSEGFRWSGGSQGVTKGILMWSEVFTAETTEGDVAVVLLDTQGSFDKESTVKDDVTIFALSLLASSILIYNLDEHIKENDFENLEFYTQYGKLALHHVTQKLRDGNTHVCMEGEAPFQKLSLLVRDWAWPSDYAYGAEGGKQYRANQWDVIGQHEEIRNRRDNLEQCFSEISCFLLPRPGEEVNRNRPGFPVNLNDPEIVEFLKHLQDFIPTIFAKKALKIKTAGAKTVKCKDMVHYFKTYMNILKSDDMPVPKSKLERTIQVNNLVSKASALERYRDKMEDFCGGGRPYIKPKDVELKHLQYLKLALEKFDSMKKMGGTKRSQEYRDKLTEEIREACLHFKTKNESKHIFKPLNVLLALFFTWGIFYAVSQVSAKFEFYSLQIVMNCFICILFAVSMIWAYVKYSGKFRCVGVKIDAGANLVLKCFTQVFQSMGPSRLQRQPSKQKEIKVEFKEVGDSRSLV